MFCDSTATMSAARASIASATFSSSRWRSEGVVSRQAGKASAAARMAASTSSASETGACAITCSVTGSMIWLVRPDTVSTGLPPT